MNNPRRNLLKGMALTSAALATNLAFSVATNAVETKSQPLKGNIKHSVARWTYGDLSVED